MANEKKRNETLYLDDETNRKLIEQIRHQISQAEHHKFKKYLKPSARRRAEFSAFFILSFSGIGYGALLGSFFFPGLGTMMGIFLGFGVAAALGIVGASLRHILPVEIEKGAESTLMVSALSFAVLGALIGTFFFPGLGTIIGLSCGAGTGLLGMATVYAAQWSVIGIREAFSAIGKRLFGDRGDNLSNEPEIHQVSSTGNRPSAINKDSENPVNSSENDKIQNESLFIEESEEENSNFNYPIK